MIWSGVPVRDVVKALGGVTEGMVYLTNTGGEKMRQGLDPVTVMVEQNGYRFSPLGESGKPSDPGRRSLQVLLLSATLIANAVEADDDVMQQGKKLFLSGTTPACGICHTLADAGSSGEIGPPLDDLKPDAVRVEKAVRQGWA